MTVIELRAEGGLFTVTPGGSPLVTDPVAGLDALVLEVAGGHLSWSLLSGTLVPAAVLDDVDAAQDWLWAVYGEEVALAVADGYPHALTARPAQPDLVAALRRLAYAHWVTRWWPASTIDAIPALDARLLDDEIVELTDICDMVLDGADASGLDGWITSAPVHGGWITAPDSGASDTSGSAITGPETPLPPSNSGHPSADPDERDFPAADIDEVESQSSPRSEQGNTGQASSGGELPASGGRSTAERAEDYALAAGGGHARDGLVLARGEGGWDWRRCPPGILDASENAVSWQVSRAAGVSTVRVEVIAAPDCRAPVPAHLRPHAYVRTDAFAAEQSTRSTSTGHESAATAGVSSPDALPPERVIPLQLHRDLWTGTTEVPLGAESSVAVRVFVPGVGPANPPGDEAPLREQIRQFARTRLSDDDGRARLAAETAAADAEGDF
ncbi:hypothetical protein ACFXK0_26150 [Nocardia sp. NPDC059177]|uniref:hypothetical protein n=1 Tax=Nocardia sp. NPDC059177 TaxID=3346759 RepID=UPI0036CFB62A